MSGNRIVLRPPATRMHVLARIALFSVVYVILRLLGIIPMIGVQGAFAVSDVVAPLYGLLLGPWVGAASIILGTFVAFALGRPVLFLFLDFLPATAAALAVGWIVGARRSWTVGAYILSLGLFVAHPITLKTVAVGEVSMPFPWLQLVAFVLLLVPQLRLGARAREGAGVARAFAVFLLALIGTALQHLVGGLVWATTVGLVLARAPPQGWTTAWTLIFFVYPWERLALALVSTAVTVPLLRTLRGTAFLAAPRIVQT